MSAGAGTGAGTYVTGTGTGTGAGATYVRTGAYVTGDTYVRTGTGDTYVSRGTTFSITSGFILVFTINFGAIGKTVISAESMEGQTVGCEGFAYAGDVNFLTV